MMNELTRLGRATLDAANDIENDLHNTVLKFLLLFVVVLPLGIGTINILGGRKINYVIILFGVVYGAWRLLRPKYLLAAGGAGALFAALWDTDKSQGVVKGILFWYRLAMNILFYFLIVSLPLATWNWAGNYEALLAFIVAALLAVTASTIIGFKGKTLGWIGLLYALAIMAASIWQTTPTEFKNLVPSVAGWSASEKEVAEVPVNLTKNKKVKVTVWRESTVVIEAPASSKEAIEICAYVLARDALRFEPKFTWTAGMGWAKLQFSQGTKDIMESIGTKKYDTIVEIVPRGTCPKPKIPDGS